MTISPEAQAQIDQLAAQIAELTKQNTQLVDAQVQSAMAVREAEAVALCERLKLPATEVEINFSEIGGKAEKAKTSWKPFLVSLGEQQFEAFGQLASDLAKSSDNGGGLMFSEFDKPLGTGTSATPISLSEADTKDLSKRVNQAREKALTAYSTGKAIS
jgi:hypothetical protein